MILEIEMNIVKHTAKIRKRQRIESDAVIKEVIEK